MDVERIAAMAGAMAESVAIRIGPGGEPLVDKFGDRSPCRSCWRRTEWGLPRLSLKFDEAWYRSAPHGRAPQGSPDAVVLLYVLATNPADVAPGVADLQPTPKTACPR
jgi:hypothetical protein